MQHKKILTVVIIAIAVLLPFTALAADPDLTKAINLIKSNDDITIDFYMLASLSAGPADAMLTSADVTQIINAVKARSDKGKITVKTKDIDLSKPQKGILRMSVTTTNKDGKTQFVSLGFEGDYKQAYASANNIYKAIVEKPAAEGDTKQQATSTVSAARAAVDAEEGNIFEKILAQVVVSVATAIQQFGRGLLDFKDLDTLIFNKGETVDALITNPVIMSSDWDTAMNTWFTRMQILAFPILLISVIITGFRFINAGTKGPRAREEAIDAVQRLALSGILLLFAPTFINTLLKVNNALVMGISSMIGNGSSLSDTIGLSDNLISSIKTGSPLLTAFVILLFAFLEFRLNIMFFMRMFSITVLYIFTPFVTALWTIEKSVSAAGIWMGEIISNIFMQTAYAFVFMIFLQFTPYMGTGGTLVCAMVLIPISEMIRNSVQNLWIRLSGFDEAGASSKVAGMLGTIAALPTLGKTVAAQFGGMSSAGKALGAAGKGAAGAAAAGAAAGVSAAGGSGASGTGGSGASAAAAAGMMSMAGASGSAGSGGAADSVSGAAGESSAGGPAQEPPGVHSPVMGGSVSNARANMITGLGLVQGAANIAQTLTHGVASVAALPAGQAGQQLASGLGSLAGTAVRAVGTPLAMAGSSIATSLQNKEGVKGVGKAWNEAVGVQGGGWRNNIKAAGRSVQVASKTTFSGLNAAADTINYHSRVDSLDKMRP